VSDLESFRQYRRLENTTTSWSANEDAVRIRLRPLGGATVWLRPRTADRYALRGTFSDVFHRPPPQLKKDSIRVIWDLGANIGLTMSDLAYRYPGARVIGVELDPDNAALCRRNLAPWADRCRLVEAAVWCEDGELEYRRDPGMEQGFRIGPVARSPTNARANSVSLNTLLSQTPDRSGIDRIVCIHDKGVARARMGERRVAGPRQTLIAPVAQQQHAGESLRMLLQPRAGDSKRIVRGRDVVNHDKLDGGVTLRQNRIEALWQELGIIVEADRHRHQVVRRFLVPHVLEHNIGWRGHEHRLTPSA